MFKFHEYLARRDGISLEEAARRSLARTWELAQPGKVMVLITAFVQGLPYEKNAARNAVLAIYICHVYAKSCTWPIKKRDRAAIQLIMRNNVIAT